MEPNLDSCPDCGGYMTEGDGHKACYGCGFKEPIITTTLKTAQLQALLPMLGELFAGGGEAGAGMLGGELGGLAGGLPGGVAGGMGGGAMAGPMGGALTNGGLARAIAANPVDDLIFGGTGAGGPSDNASVAPAGFGAAPGTYGSIEEQMWGYGHEAAWQTEEIGTAVQDRGDDVDPSQASSSGSGYLKDMGDGPELLKDVDDLGGPKGERWDLHAQEFGFKDLPSFADTVYKHLEPVVHQFNDPEHIRGLDPEELHMKIDAIEALDELLEAAYPGYKDQHVAALPKFAWKERTSAEEGRWWHNTWDIINQINNGEGQYEQLDPVHRNAEINYVRQVAEILQRADSAMNAKPDNFVEITKATVQELAAQGMDQERARHVVSDWSDHWMQKLSPETQSQEVTELEGGDLSSYLDERWPDNPRIFCPRCQTRSIIQGTSGGGPVYMCTNCNEYIDPIEIEPTTAYAEQAWPDTLPADL